MGTATHGEDQVQALRRGGRNEDRHEPCQFFYSTLKTRDRDKIIHALHELERQRKRLVDEAFAISFYYRGGVDYDSVMDNMTAYERKRAEEWHAKYMDRELKARPMSPNY